MIWFWCYQHNNWVSAAHLPGVQNVVADRESRSIHDNMEWQLDKALFRDLCKIWGTPEIDLFASRLNAQLPRYFSWKPDPCASAVDALSENWEQLFFYAFPPFNMIGRVLQKVTNEHCRGIMIVPYWPTQPWYPKLMEMCLTTPFVLCSRNGNAVLTHRWRTEEELPRMKLLAVLISSQDTSKLTSVGTHYESSWRHGNKEHKSNTELIYNSGVYIVLRGTSVKCPRL